MSGVGRFLPSDYAIRASALERIPASCAAAWALLMNEWVDAQKALKYGLVNEVLPTDKLLNRAWEIAQLLASRKRITRRMTVQVLRRPWKQQLMDNLDVGWSSEMWAFLADNPNHRKAAEASDRLTRSGGGGTSKN